MTEKREQSRHVTFEQAKSILDFMGQHVEFASGNLRSLEARHTSKKLWADLTIILNSCRGTKKTSDGWSKYWSDYKNKLKRRVWLLKKKKSNRPLTKLEKRALVILGPYFDKKSRDGYSNTLVDPLPPQVKLESFHEVTSELHKPHNESNDRTSDIDDNNSGVTSDDECVDDNDCNDLALSNLYPKWLIEVEKKRAEAELIRAKAEEQRAVVAAKNAEAVLLQADALKRLADAASVQAEAVMRIAAVLECRGQTDMLAI